MVGTITWQILTGVLWTPGWPGKHLPPTRTGFTWWQKPTGLALARSYCIMWFFIKIFTVFLHKNIYCRPSPRELSEAFMKGSDGHGSVRNRTTMLAFFGQVSNSTINMRKKWLQCTLLIDKRKKYKQSPAQVVTSEILMASEMQSCPIEVTKIPISRSLLWWLDDDREIMLFDV